MARISSLFRQLLFSDIDFLGKYVLPSLSFAIIDRLHVPLSSYFVAFVYSFHCYGVVECR